MIVNPIAGMGGPVALKGTDGPADVATALRLGGQPLANDRARRALMALAATGPLEIMTAGGLMGEDAVRQAGHRPIVVHHPAASSTSLDTRNAAQEMRDAHCGLILFAGGDGTARDIFGIVEDKALMLGIPTGVKMHSGVFGTTPESAGQLAALCLSQDAIQLQTCEAEIMDRDDRPGTDGRFATRLFGYARTPFERRLIQSAKSTVGHGDDASLEALCAQLAETLTPGCLYILGPGTTTARILHHLGLGGSLLGIDAVRDGRLVGRDLTESDILALLDTGPAKAIVGVIGGQGCLFGRGNQQLGARALARIGRENVIVAASLNKITGLKPARLFVDTGDISLDAVFSGFIPVQIGPGRSVMLRVGG
ncbi:ATP-NAD kinase family protein [Microvirga antarctica]|uniref:ATP-NAD kinase family protein n=1 Tax=Microvirga antarctica TaxID=2819233 RepID=UPI001B308425